MQAIHSGAFPHATFRRLVSLHGPRVQPILAAIPDVLQHGPEFFALSAGPVR
jgi:hypothetical protein